MSQTITNNLESGVEEMDEDIFVAFSLNLTDLTSAHLVDMFSASIFNAEFDTSGKRTQQPRARDRLKGMVQAWVAHFVTPLKCTHDKYDWRVMNQKPHKSTNHLTNTITMMVKPLAPPVAYI
jgi:hypothetical protein